jgi:predicted RNA-binding Zn-ribbon protein involved in translation (DUF1610 family)
MWWEEEITGYQLGTVIGVKYMCPECAEAYVKEVTEGRSSLKEWVEYNVAFQITNRQIWYKPLKCDRCGKAIKVILDDRGQETFIMECPTLEEARKRYGEVGVYWYTDAMKDPAMEELARKIQRQREEFERENREKRSDIWEAVERLRLVKSILLKANNR